MMRLVAIVPVLAGLYLLFAGSLDAVEIGAAVLFTVPAAALAWAMPACSDTRFSARAPWLRVLARPLWNLLAETPLVGGRLLRAVFGTAPPGAAVPQSFAEPAAAGAGPATRRALVTLGISLSPNGYVVHVPPEGAALVVHRLAPQRAARNAWWPL